MMGINHVAGGIVFTGVFSSLFNINVFDSIHFVSFCVFFSLLPDIDHTKSLIGKLFYPISRLISRKYGHRTITHSLFFYFSVVFFLFSCSYFGFFSSDLSVIASFALLSHFILDMVTLQGIPLFFPWVKNPCVIPGNRNLRFRTGNLKAEGMAFFLFSLFALLLQPLFAKGFWLSYSNNFNSLTHVAREYKRDNKIMVLDFQVQYFDQLFDDRGFVLYSEENHLEILTKDTLFRFSKNPNFLVKKFDFRKLDFDLSFVPFSFSNISIDSLNSLFNRRYIFQADIFSSDEVIFEGKKNTVFNFGRVFSPSFSPIIKDENNPVLEQLFLEKRKANLLQQQVNDKRHQLKSNSLSDFEKSEIISFLISSDKKLIEFAERIKILQIQKAMIPIKKNIAVSGKFFYFSDLEYGEDPLL